MQKISEDANLCEGSISIIIPTYNRLETLKKVIPSYLNQKHLKEIIIVDDGSIDGTQAYFEALCIDKNLFKYIRHDQRKNLPASRNSGIENAKGEYVLFGEDDVMFEQDYAAQLLNCLLKNKADIIAGRLIDTYVGEEKTKAVARANSDRRPLIIKKLIFGRYWVNLTNDVEIPIGVHACALIKKVVFKKVIYDEAYIGNADREETDFYITAIKEGFRIYYCPHTLAYHLKPIRGKAGSGGCWPSSYLKNGYWFLRNNSHFLKKHLPHLRRTLGIEESIFIIQTRFFFHVMIRFVLQNFFKKTFPNFYQKILSSFYKIRKGLKKSLNAKV